MLKKVTLFLDKKVMKLSGPEQTCKALKIAHILSEEISCASCGMRDYHEEHASDILTTLYKFLDHGKPGYFYPS